MIRPLRDRVAATRKFWSSLIPEQPGPARVEPLECRQYLTFTVTNVNDSGAGSLRQAILGANAYTAPYPASIVFNIPGAGLHVIKPITPLPSLGKRNATIAGSSENLFMKEAATPPAIEINGSGIKTSASGLTITGSSDVVSNIQVIDFTNAGIVVTGGCTSVSIDANVLAGNGGAAGGNLELVGCTYAKVQGNFIGTDPTGNKSLTNTGDGILLKSSANDNTIGGTASSNRNVISGNNNGIEISGSGDNVIAGNYIGLNASGAVLPNHNDGILIDAGANSNTIGLPSHGNTISGNAVAGIEISSDGNLIQGNFVGTNTSGTSAIGNKCGILLDMAASNNLIGSKSAGSVTSGSANVISGNTLGIEFQGSLSPPNTIKGNVVAGNRIGTDAAGKHAVPNTRTGVDIQQVNEVGTNMIGLPFDGNLISGNGGGINIAGSSSVKVQGNFIGTDITGSAKIPNGEDGIVVQQSDYNLIGTTASGGVATGAANVISGNKRYGITVGDFSFGNTIAGNRIGVDVSGEHALGNAGAGIWVTADCDGNAFGLANDGNVISGNGVGILIQNAKNNTVEGNFIGLDLNGTSAIANQYGIQFSDAQQGYPTTGNIIGLAADGAINYVSGNSIDGILVSDPTTTGNPISIFNVLGFNTSGNSVPNGLHDILYNNGATP